MAVLSSPTFSVISAPASAETSSVRNEYAVSLRHVMLALPDGRIILNDLNETFRTERVGIVGRNGAGKSLLARTLVDLLMPDSGKVSRSDAVTYVPQDIAVGDHTTIADVMELKNVFDALHRVECGNSIATDLDLLDGRWTIRAILQSELEECGLGYLQPHSLASVLSGGELTRIALIGAFHSQSRGLILDEPTNHLDRDARQWLRQKIEQWRGGVIVVSHDRELLDGMDRIVELTADGLRSYGGNYAFYKAQREVEALAAQAALDHARTERNIALRGFQKQHDAQLRRATRAAKTAKVANMSGLERGYFKNRAESFSGREDLRRQEARAALDDAVARAAERIDQSASVALILPATAVPSGKRVLQLEQAIAPFPQNSRPLTFTLSGPMRVAITGANGAGKTTLLKILAGMIEPLSGNCRTFVHSAWLDQRAAALLPPDRSLLERLRELETPLAEGVLRSHLSLLGLQAEHVKVPSKSLSGGERLKAALACAIWSKTPAQLLLLDEPTNHLDLDSVLAMEHALKSYTGALVVVSHDAQFLASLMLTHTLELRLDGDCSLRAQSTFLQR